MSLKQFSDQLIGLSSCNEKIDPKYLKNIYKKIQREPFIISGQKLNGSIKNNQEEKKNILESTFKN